MRQYHCLPPRSRVQIVSANVTAHGGLYPFCAAPYRRTALVKLNTVYVLSPVCAVELVRLVYFYSICCLSLTTNRPSFLFYLRTSIA